MATFMKRPARAIQRLDVTTAIVNELVARRYETLSDASVKIARQCVLDWLGVTMAAADEPLVRILAADSSEQGGAPHASVVRGGRNTIYDAALVNGAAGHALDYDDVAFAMSAHASAAILPALMALAQFRKANGRAVLTAFIAGYEAGCRIGTLVAPGHYDAGFHGTATIGTFAAAAACSHLLGLDAEHVAQTIGIAATQAAGIQCMFGTMCKPLHAGKAAQNGLRAAVLAAKGFESRPDALECAQGFASTHSADFSPEFALAEPEGGYFVYKTLFKYHASCYMTHSVIENVLKLRPGILFDPHALKSMTVTINPKIDTVCNIAAPQTGLEVKFSLRHCAALILAGIDTSRLETFSDRMAADPRLVKMREKIAVEFNEQQPQTFSEVIVDMESGERLTASHDSDVPDKDLARQMSRLVQKFRSLSESRIGIAAANRVIELVVSLHDQPSVEPLLELCLGAPTQTVKSQPNSIKRRM
jgi:2-methylcitrate dehydratase PrpD